MYFVFFRIISWFIICQFILDKLAFSTFFQSSSTIINLKQLWSDAIIFFVNLSFLIIFYTGQVALILKLDTQDCANGLHWLSCLVELHVVYLSDTHSRNKEVCTWEPRQKGKHHHPLFTTNSIGGRSILS